MKKFLKKYFNLQKGSNSFCKQSYSQCGEDLIVDYIFQLRGINMPSYLDIGANHPYYLNNTSIFYKRGCRGVNIEANPTLIPAFLKERSRDITLNIGVGDRNGKMDFFVMQDPTLSTFSGDEVQSMKNHGKELEKKIKIDVKNINEILEEYFLSKDLDFLTIDVEGLDLAILQVMDFSRFSPKIICVEAADYSPIGAGERRNELIDMLLERGYFEYANTNLNAIMVRKNFWFI